MAGQITGYYTARQEKLVSRLEASIRRIRPFVANKYSDSFADRLIKETGSEFSELIPEIPYIKGIRAGMFNSFLLVSAQELAVFRAMKKLDKTAEEAWLVCHEALISCLEEIPQWKKNLMKRLMFSGLVKRVVARRARKKQVHHFGEFTVEYVGAEKGVSDYGVNYLQCGNYEFVKRYGGEEFAPYICLSDIALSDGLGWGLSRSETLADGCGKCDFRFRQGADTCISSKSSSIQSMIDTVNKKSR